MLELNLFVRLIFASLLADFVFQPSSLVMWKQRQFRGLLVHIVIVFLVSLLVGQGFWSRRYVGLTAALALVHLSIDWAKIVIDRQAPYGYWPLGTFVGDQALHLLVILLLLAPFGYLLPVTNVQAVQFLFDNPVHVGVVSLYIVSVLAGSVVVRFIVQPFQVDVGDRPGLLGAGAYIGMVERFLLTTLVAAGQFGAVGFVLAAKSVARYKQLDEVPGFAEYYLVGTLTSSAIALLTGLLVKRLIN